MYDAITFPIVAHLRLSIVAMEGKEKTFMNIRKPDHESSLVPVATVYNRCISATLMAT